MGVTVTDILTEYGAYYEKSGQNRRRLIKALLQPSVTAETLTPVRTDETIHKLANVAIDDLLQPFQKNFTAKGDVTFTPNKLELHHLKVDFSVYPDDIEASWLGFLANSDLDRSKWPLVRYLMEEYLIPKIIDNKELKAIYKGVQSDPTTDVAGSPSESMNGLRKALRDANGNGANIITGIGALDESTIFDQVEDFDKQISELYQSVPMEICLSPQFYRAFLRDKRAQGFYQITGPNEIDDSVDFSPRRVKGLPSMNGTSDMWATPKANKIHLMKKSQNMRRFEVQKFDRQVKIMTDWWEGVGFGINEAVFMTEETANAASGSV